MQAMWDGGLGYGMVVSPGGLQGFRKIVDGFRGWGDLLKLARTAD